MNRTQSLLAFACGVCLYPFAAIFVFANPAGVSDILPTAQNQYASINVNGRTLTGPNSSTQRRDGQILIPIMALAGALGDVVSVDAGTRTVNVRRQGGTISELDARIGQIRENGTSILTISNAGAIIFPPNTDDLFLPTEITATLFDVAIRYDRDKNAVIVTRGQPNSVVSQNKSDRGFADLYQVEYEYSLNRYSSSTSHDLILSGAGRIADGRFYFSSSSSNSSQHGISLRNGTFSFERPNGQRYVAGDFGTGTDLQFLSSSVRGGMAKIPVGGTAVIAFAGQTYSGAVQPEADSLQLQPTLTTNHSRFRYYTGVFGLIVTTNTPIAGQRINPWTFSAGAMRFSGSNRSGGLVSGSASYNTSRFRFQGDVAYGKFSGRRADNKRTNNYAAAIDLAGTFQITSNLVVQARYAHIGMKFLSPQAGLREPIDLKAAGISWTPRRWFSTSINASVVSRPGDPTKRDGFVTSAFNISPGGGAPRFFFSHTQSGTKQIRSSAFTYLNASKEFSRWRFFLNATRRKTVGPAAYNSQVGASFRVNDDNQLDMSQGFGSKGSYNGQFDWRTSNLLNQKLSFSVGGGYNYNHMSKFSGYERVTAALNLPRNTSLQVSYMHTNAGSTLMVSLRGALFQKPKATAYLSASISEINSMAKVEGRVYQDLDLNGRFDPQVDKPQPDVKVRVDGNRYVVSDVNGMYRFDSVTAGAHTVYLDLLSVRADLTLLGNDVQKATLAEASISTVDFRLVRTGRLRGRVWLDTNGNGNVDEGEKPLADVRVVTGSGRDTLTDADGYFVISDLAPGEHVIIVDQKTLPEKTMPGFKPVAVQVYPGRETGEVDLAVILVPADFRWFSKRQNN